MTDFCIPGEKLAEVSDGYLSGPGTYETNGCIFSTLAGKRMEEKRDDENVVFVKKFKNSLVPTVGSVVTAKVTSITPRFCKCSIVAVDGSLISDSFRALIRKEDVRAMDRDSVEIQKCFRPGDIVLAKVLTMGDSNSYLLTTAENELGVVIAKSEAGEHMLPVSWCEMRCPKTLESEPRKVAKVAASNIEVAR